MIKRGILIFFIFIFLLNTSVYTQIQRETRAVWLTTNFRLDWPPPRYDEELQKKTLTGIFDDIRDKNFNTVYFQVRFNGTVLYKSDLEPMSFYITGQTGDPKAYDPLKFAIELAHKRGLEIHAWINVLKCYDGQEKNLLDNKEHIYQKHPEWLVKDTRDGSTAYWFDPGLPEVRNYLTDVVYELISNYDLDGIHYDYLRYPGKNFDDDFSFRVHGSGTDKDEWRRNNLNELVKSFSGVIKEAKPFLKIGAAPIGIYKNLPYAKGLEGYYDVYQDSRQWLKSGYLDYVVPQIYWGLDGNPRFDVLAKDWNENSSGRTVVLGIGAYKPEVYGTIDKMIDVSRKINAGGVAFFRYQNIKKYDFQLFSNKAFPTQMAWLDGTKPNPPTSLEFEFINGNDGILNLKWNNPQMSPGNDSLRYFSLYSIMSPDSKPSNEDLFEIISSERSSVVIGIKRPKKVNYYFTLKSLTKLWNESSSNSNVIKVTFPSLNALCILENLPEEPVIVKKEGEIPKLFCISQGNDIVEVRNGDKIFERQIGPGKNVITLGREFLSVSDAVVKFKNSGQEFKVKL